MNIITFSLPSFIGSIKTHMYDFHYNDMRKMFQVCKLLFTDTDAFCCSILHAKDVYAVIKDSEWLDFSNLPEEDTNYNVTNLMVPVKFKVECNNFP